MTVQEKKLVLEDLPVDIDNEALILANAIKDEKNREILVNRVDFNDFRIKENQGIAFAIKQIHEKRLEMNPDTLVLMVKSSPVRYGIDFEYVQKMEEYDVVPEANLEQHIQKLQLDKLKNDLAKEFYESIFASCLKPESSLAELHERLEKVNNVLKKGYSHSQLQFKTMETVIADYERYRKEKRAFYTTGFRQLDEKLTEGLKPKGITIVAGLPGSGKSSMTLSMMNNLANQGIYTAQFALEMDNNAIASKLAGYRTGIPVKKIVKYFDTLEAKEKELLEYELQRLASNKYMLFNDTPSQTLATIREQIKILQDRMRQEYFVIVIDLFGKIREFQESENFARDYEKKLNDVQIMAKELSVNIVPVAQIHREVVGRKFNRPKMSDIKNAGAWEEVADIILGVHRPWYNPEVAMAHQIAMNEYQYNHGEEPQEEEDNPLESVAEVLILKQRMGEGNQIINFMFDKHTTRYMPITQEYQDDINMQKDDFDEAMM
jgi:replicative DNA helicase